MGEKRERAPRLEFRVDAETKKQVQKAAALERKSLTDFCLSTLIETTKATIAKHEAVLLSDRDREVFFQVLMHPPKPNPRLRRALRQERITT
jgi:uncharacterized protein (DUF1778 family)